MAGTRTIDLNADLGEGFGRYRCGDDGAMLAVVTSANVACGFHAGDHEIMAATFAEATARGVVVGAHPGLPDLWGFGRRRWPVTDAEAERMIAYQLGAALGMAALVGCRVRHFKPHGALGNMSAEEPSLAAAVARAARAVDPSLVFLCIAGSAQPAAAEKAGLAVAAEIFADRAYAENGQLAPRGLAGAVIHDPDAAAGRVLAMVEAGALLTVSGRFLPAFFNSVCVHGDGSAALATATLVRRRLDEAGVAVAAFAP